MIRRFLEKLTAEQYQPEPADTAMAAAVLMTEIVRADYQIDESEKAAMTQALSTLIPDRDAEALVKEAFEEAGANNDLQHFTSAIHGQWSNEQKSDLLVALWRIAYVDNQLDKYEEHMVRKIADLLYIPHSEFIRTKLIARDQ
ncbi:TerB family tellurite resistance protein [Thalassolituus sp.]|uniref:tellurite resistance TerB family protein n=1 Tax=Thalassolituus sp. TaxID=2030822 RepID=UPI0035174D28